MPSQMMVHNLRRSTRVPLKVVITIEADTGNRTCEGETIVVNLQGALIATTVGLSTGMRISIHVYVTDKRAAALSTLIPAIWGVPLPPNDWDEKVASETRAETKGAPLSVIGISEVVSKSEHASVLIHKARGVLYSAAA